MGAGIFSLGILFTIGATIFLVRKCGNSTLPHASFISLQHKMNAVHCSVTHNSHSLTPASLTLTIWVWTVLLYGHSAGRSSVFTQISHLGIIWQECALLHGLYHGMHMQCISLVSLCVLCVAFQDTHIRSPLPPSRHADGARLYLHTAHVPDEASLKDTESSTAQSLSTTCHQSRLECVFV